MDAQLVEKIVLEVKSQGVFDEFRKDSIADVDTKPAYQNLRQRVENTVKKFLAEQKWTMETNKNQLREKLRRHITESGFLDVGVERIVDQVVNPKIGSVFQPRIEEIAYKYLGLPPPPKKFDPPPPPLMHPLPPLPLNAPPLKIETCSLLPTDLEQVSPDSDNATIKSEDKNDSTAFDMEAEEKFIEDEDESPPFEPLIKEEESKDDVKPENKKETNIKQKTEVSNNEEVNIFEEINEETFIKAEIVATNNDSLEMSNFAAESMGLDKEASRSVDARVSQESQLSSVSSDSRLSANVKDATLQSSSQEAVAANISEEAQMPKFSENSCEFNVTNSNSGEKVAIKSELHFDIKKDEIKFEGTERKIGLETFESVPVKTEEERYLSIEGMNAHQENKNDAFNFATENLSTEVKVEDEEEAERTPNAQELSFGSSIEDSSSVPPSQTPKNDSLCREKEEKPQEIQTLKELIRPATPITASIQAQMPAATLYPMSTQKPEKEHQSRYSSSSSSKHKKHSKERRRSHEKDKDGGKERHRSGRETKDSSKYHSSSGSKSSSNRHCSSSSSSKYYSTHSKSTEKDIEKSSSSSTHSSSKHAKHSNSHSSSSSSIENQDSKKSKHDPDRRHRSSSSSKRSERKDDHTEAKQKIQRRKSTDSNEDDDGNKSLGYGKSSCQYKSYTASYGSKSTKSGSSENKSSTYKTKESQKYPTESKEHVEETAYKKLQLNNNVVILNDLLENPQTQFIQLNNTGHLIEMPLQQKSSATMENERNEIVTTEFNNNVKLYCCEDKHQLELKEPSKNVEREPYSKKNLVIEENETNSKDLLSFEKIDITDRLKLLNATMDLCRSAVNGLRFDSLSDEGVELSNDDEDIHCEHDNILLLTETLKRKSDSNYEEFAATPRKRFTSNESEGCQSKSSPTPSDTSSVNSKENEEICKNTNRAKKSLLNHHKAIQKLTQKQRYSSEDLYKPRPILGQRSRRRGMDSLV